MILDTTFCKTRSLDLNRLQPRRMISILSPGSLLNVRSTLPEPASNRIEINTQSW